jgi:hypothetical protein
MSKAWRRFGCAAVVVLFVSLRAMQPQIEAHSATESVSQRDRVTGQRTLSLQDRSQQIPKGNLRRAVYCGGKASGKSNGTQPGSYERIKRIFPLHREPRSHKNGPCAD